MQHLPVERQRLDRFVRVVEQCAAGRLVAAPRFHADEAVLHDVDTPDAVLARDLIRAPQEGDGGEGFAVNGDGVARLEVYVQSLRRVWRVFRVGGALPHPARRLRPGVLEDAALVRGVEEVGVRRVRFLFGDGNRDAVLLRVRDTVFAPLQIPLAPGGDNFDIGVEGVRGEFEAHLVVALARRAVRHRVRAFALSDLDHALGDERAGERGAQEVVAFVRRTGTQHREDEVGDERLRQVVCISIQRTCLERFFLRLGDLLALTDVSGERNDFGVVVGFEPVQDDRRVEPARVGEDDLFDLCAVYHLLLLIRRCSEKETTTIPSPSVTRVNHDEKTAGSGFNGVGRGWLRMRYRAYGSD